MTRARARQLLAFLLVAWLPALLGRDAVGSAAGLYSLAESAHPYCVPAHAGLLYLWSPLVVASAVVLFLSPGLFLALALDAADSVGQWIVSALALSLVVVSGAAAVVQSLLGSPLRGAAFAAVVMACACACCGVLLVRLTRGVRPAWPLTRPHSTATLASMAVVPLLLLIALTPKFYWENFNGDGVHGFESARLLLVQPIPLWPRAAGDIASFPGITSVLFTFPASWFIRLFGEVEASARLPFLLDLIALYAVVLALIEHERRTALGVAERWLLWSGLAVYAVTVAFSATYSPYSADIGLPATQDTLALVCFLGFVLAFLQRREGWMVLFVALTFSALPNGLLLVGMWLAGVFLVWRPWPWRAGTVTVGAAFGCTVAAAIGPLVLAALHLPVPGSEYALANLAKRFAFLQWADWRRLGFVVVPSGILPVVALFAWRSQDRLSRTFTVVTIAYVGFFYLPAHTALHYFIPAMIFPLVIFWRSHWVLDTRSRPFMLVGTAVAGGVALWLSLPIHTTPHTTARLIGSTIEDRMGGYDRLDPAAFRRTLLLRHLFPLPWDPQVPGESYGGSELVWNYYAHHTDSASRAVNYVLRAATPPAPEGMHPLAQEDEVALYVRSDDVWASQLAIRPPTPAGSATYAIPRDVLFGFGRPADEPAVIDVRQVMEGLGIDVDTLLGRLGVQH